MNTFKKLLASTVIALSLMAPVAYAADQCMSSDQVWVQNQEEAKSKGLTLDHVTLKGDDAAKLFEYLEKKFDGAAMEFDEITFITNRADDSQPVLMVIYKDGCVIAGGPISPAEFMELVGVAIGHPVTPTADTKGI